MEERGAAKPVGVQERRPPTNQMWREPRFYECGKLGHLSMRYPSKALFSEGRSAGRETTNGRNRPLRRSGMVNGKTVADIVLDTECTRTLVHDRVVPVGQRTKGAIIIRCAHGDEVTYPIAEVEISVSGRVLKVEAGGGLQDTPRISAARDGRSRADDTTP